MREYALSLLQLTLLTIVSVPEFSFGLDKHEECDEGGDDSQTPSKADNYQSPSRIFVFLVSGLVRADPEMLNIKYP